MIRFYLYIALFFLQWSEIKSEQQQPYNCAYFSKLYLKPQTSGCKNYMCWESQLTDRNRNELTKILNDYRISVAKGTCASCKGQRYGVMYELTYNWLPEYSCVLWLENSECTLPPNISIVPDLPYSEVLQRNLHAGMLKFYVEHDTSLRIFGSINTFKLEYNEFRNDVIQKIKTVLQDKEDSKRFLKSWEGEDKYIYGKRSFYGCAILVLNNMTGKTDFGGKASNERVAFLACMFVPLIFKGSENEDPVATKVNGFNSIVDCPSDIKDKSSFVTRIGDKDNDVCYFHYQVHRNDRLDFYDRPCQIYYHTYKGRQGARCNGEIPSEWAYNVYPNDELKIIDIRRIEDTLESSLIPRDEIFERLDRLNPPTTTTKFTTTTTTRKPELNTTTINPYTLMDDQEEGCNSFLSVHCASLVTIFIIVSVFAFILLICLLTR